MATRNLSDPYQLRPENIEDPPRTYTSIFRRIGPGLILASGIVGSGELIATTVLGAEAGYTLLWLIILSCFIKVVVQNELGRYAIGTGETTLEAFDRAPGPRLRASWLVWAWFLMVMFTLLQVGGMLGGVSEVLNRLVPAVPIGVWVWVVNLLTVVLLIGGRYWVVEKISMGLVVCFTVLTVSSAFLMFKLPQYFSWSQVVSGLTFQLPESGLITAVAAFGITGVGATELVVYPYWCLEKGYARYSGPRDGSPAWRERAGGWIRVMGVDVVNSMVIYTFATVAFYLLGAGILHGRGPGAQRLRDGPGACQHVHRNHGRMVPAALPGGCFRGALFHHLRRYGGAQPGVRRFRRHLEALRQDRLPQTSQGNAPLRGHPSFRALPLFHVSAGAGADGHHRRSGPGPHAARHRLLHRLPALPPHAGRDPAGRMGDRGPLDLGPGHGPHDGLFPSFSESRA